MEFDTILGLKTAPIAASFPRYPSMKRLDPTNEFDWEYIIAYDSTIESDVRIGTRAADGIRKANQSLEEYLSWLADLYRMNKQREIVHLASGQTWLIIPNELQGTRSSALSLFGDKVVFVSVATYQGVSDMHLHRFIRGIFQQ